MELLLTLNGPKMDLKCTNIGSEMDLKQTLEIHWKIPLCNLCTQSAPTWYSMSWIIVERFILVLFRGQKQQNKVWSHHWWWRKTRENRVEWIKGFTVASAKKGKKKKCWIYDPIFLFCFSTHDKLMCKSEKWKSAQTISHVHFLTVFAFGYRF